MKKVILTVAMVAMASVVQAASIAWSSAGLKPYAGNAYQVFVIGVLDVNSIETVTAKLDAKESTTSYAVGEGVIGTTGFGNGSASADKTVGTGSFESFMVLFNSASKEEATQYVVLSGASGQTVIAEATTAKVTFKAGDMSAVVGNPENWKPMGVPEPTSGLLFIVGGALLALRRKQK